jgi:hypothetical protein
MNRRCTIDGCSRPMHARGLCSAHYGHWRQTGEPHWAEVREVDGPGVCVCPISRPAPKCCTVCGFPCVHRMAPEIRDLALAKMPSLRHQTIAIGERGVA